MIVKPHVLLLEQGKAPQYALKTEDKKAPKKARPEKKKPKEGIKVPAQNQDISLLSARIKRLEAENKALKERLEKKLDSIISTMYSEIDRIVDSRLDSLDSDMDEKLARMLESKLDNLIDSRAGKIDKIVDSKLDSNLHGFYLVQRKTTGTELYWYAGKSIGGKQKWVYVGKDKSQAKAKIEAWLAKHPEPEREKQGELFKDNEIDKS